MHSLTSYCARQALGVPQPQAKGPPGSGGCNNLSRSALEGILYFISPTYKYFPPQSRIFRVILHVQTIFTCSLVYPRTYPPPGFTQWFLPTAVSSRGGGGDCWSTGVGVGGGGHNHLSDSALDGILYFILPHFHVETHIFHVKTLIFQVIFHVQTIFTRSLVYACTYPPPGINNGSSQMA